MNERQFSLFHLFIRQTEITFISPQEPFIIYTIYTLTHTLLEDLQDLQDEEEAHRQPNQTLGGEKMKKYIGRKCYRLEVLEILDYVSEIE